MSAFHNSFAETTHLYTGRRLWVAMLACAAVWLGCVMLPDRLVAEVGHAPASDISLQQDVLTLEDVATFLRVERTVVEQLAQQHCLPGRRVGTQWRFHRTAVLAWLARTDATPDCDISALPTLQAPSAPAPPVQGSERTPPPPRPLSTPPLPSSSLAGMRGRGTETTASEATPAPESKPETVGTKPDQPRAEDVFLRSQRVLLGARELTLELDLLYTRSDQQDIQLLPAATGVVPTLAQQKQQTFTSLYTARFGLFNNLQLVASIPLLLQTDTLTVLNTESSHTRTTGGDFTLGLRRTLLREGVGYPEVIASLGGAIPIGPSSYGVGGGIALVKTIDPVALFANVNYRRTFSREFGDVTRLQPEHTVSTTFGYALALNDALTVSASVAGVFTPRTAFSRAVLLARERYSLQLGLTSLLAKGLYIEPTVSFGLNGPGSNVTLGVNLPYTFMP